MYLHFSQKVILMKKMIVTAQEMYTIHILLNINLLYIYKIFFVSTIKVSRAVKMVLILGFLGER